MLKNASLAVTKRINFKADSPRGSSLGFKIIEDAKLGAHTRKDDITFSEEERKAAGKRLDIYESIVKNFTEGVKPDALTKIGNTFDTLV